MSVGPALILHPPSKYKTVAKIIGKFSAELTGINGWYFGMKECEERIDNTYVEIIDL